MLPRAKTEYQFIFRENSQETLPGQREQPIYWFLVIYVYIYIYMYIDQTNLIEKMRFLRRYYGRTLIDRDLKFSGSPRYILKTKTAKF